MNLLKALATVSGMTLVSRITGLVRDLLVARYFGAGMATDAFFVANRIPNMLRRLFAEGAFSQAFVPMLAEYRHRLGQDATRDLVDHVATLLSVAVLAVTVLGVLAAPAIIYLTAPGFSDEPAKFALTVQMLRITFPYILFIALTSLAAGILNTWSRLTVPAFTPVLLNLTFIGFILVAARHFERPVLVLAWAVFFGGMAQLAFQIPFLGRLGMLPRFRLSWRHAGMRRVLRQMGPAVFGVSVAQVSLLISTIFASFLPTGSVSWLYNAYRLMEFPTGLLGVALGTVLLPSLARHFADASHEEYSRLLDWGLRLTLLLTLPAAVALAVLAVPLVSTLFYAGAFRADDLFATRQALMAYSVGLTGLILVKVLAPGFYARQDIRTPVKIALVTLAATQLMNLAFIGPLRHAGLALATGLGACLNAAILFIQLRRKGVYRPQPGWAAYAMKLALAVYAMGVVLWLAMGAESLWLAGNQLTRALRLAWVVALGAGAYFGALWLLGFRLRDFSRRAAE